MTKEIIISFLEGVDDKKVIVGTVYDYIKDNETCSNCNFSNKTQDNELYKCEILMSCTPKYAKELIECGFGCNRWEQQNEQH